MRTELGPISLVKVSHNGKNKKALRKESRGSQSVFFVFNFESINDRKYDAIENY